MIRLLRFIEGMRGTGPRATALNVHCAVSNRVYFLCRLRSPDRNRSPFRDQAIPNYRGRQGTGPRAPVLVLHCAVFNRAYGVSVAFRSAGACPPRLFQIASTLECIAIRLLCFIGGMRGTGPRATLFDIYFV